MNATWTKRLLYGAVAVVALLAVMVIAVPRTAQAFGPDGGMDGGMARAMRGGMDHGGMDHGGMRGGMTGSFAHGGSGGAHGGDRAELMAGALGISVEELQEAQAAAAEAGIQQALADERITPEQADLMLAGLKLRSYIDHQAILAAALGITPEQLQAALEDGNLRDVIAELGLDPKTLHENMQAALSAAVDEAVSDGVITAEQAEALKDAKGSFGGRGGMKGMRGSRGVPGRCGEHRGGGEFPDGGGEREFSGGFGSWGNDTPPLVATGNL